IPDVTPNGVFYLPPTGWLTSFYNPPSNMVSYNNGIT
ncbi:aldo/keto reductase, partial [Lactobacillus reuteri]|nr:aldo/keto reductase [Limosilactobacillus reuteri]